MFKLCLLLIALSAVSDAKPGVLSSVAYTGLPVAAPLAYQGPGFVTATSSQYFARNYNGIAAPLVATAPYVAAAPYVAPPVAAAPAYVF